MTAQGVPQIFDRKTLRTKRDRAAAQAGAHDFLHRQTAEALYERLLPVKTPLADLLVWGGHSGRLCRMLAEKADTKNIIWADLSRKLLQSHNPENLPQNCRIVAADEECVPFPQHCFDAVLSNLTLHSVNDLKGALIQAQRILKPSRPFMAAVFGGVTLAALRQDLLRVETEHNGGAAPRIFPFADIRAMGNMIKALGFAEPVMDSERFDISYSSLEDALADLRGMGEGNILTNRLKKPLTRNMRDILAQDLLRQGSLTVEVEIVYMIGWSPSRKGTA
ncbi:MAG: methyltransferase domain-containing protein [Pseudomonadota bacterium]|nr:methyltransferase domain-containing protein [Pseudomonadota bacterium]QKK05321.1 MAG: methyltransferase domain-containing protein [Pseudomonadota bacterium]